MRLSRRALALLVALAANSAAADVLHGSVKRNPSGDIVQIVNLMRDLSKRIELDGKTELASYDKYACWCEDTLARKAKDISTAKQSIIDLQTLIEKLQGEVGVHSAEIENINKLISENKQAQSEATEVRGQDNAEYEEEKTESEQCIGALEAAIKALAGAGTGKKGFLETLQEAQLLSVADGMQVVLKHPVASQTISNKDLAMVRGFFDQPARFAGRRASGLSAAQLTNNPFGDYAPQSDQIQGILKGLYEAFTKSLEKANAEEAEGQKSFEALMATKRAELATLQDTLGRQELEKAEKIKDMADSKLVRQDTQAQLKADEKFFAETKEACQVQATEWSTRVRLRTEELQGIDKAVEILDGESAQATFRNSSSTFLQLSSQRDVKSRGIAALQNIAKTYHSTSVAKIATMVRTRGYFGKVIQDIDKMIALVRKEEQMDILHRDRCQQAEGKNKNDKEDLQDDIRKANESLSIMVDEKREMEMKVGELEQDIAQSKTNMETLTSNRNQEEHDLKKALEADANAVALIESAIAAMSKFYKRNKILAQVSETPEYSIDPDKAPEVAWGSEGGNYGGRQGEHIGVTAILEMIKEDIVKEMETGRKDDATAREEYQKQFAALRESLNAQEETMTATNTELAELAAKIEAKDEYRDGKNGDLGNEIQLESSLYDDCKWVSENFDSRAAKRKDELSGLVAAKSYLASVEDGTALDGTFSF